jgi:hypothetical protein
MPVISGIGVPLEDKVNLAMEMLSASSGVMRLRGYITKETPQLASTQAETPEGKDALIRTALANWFSEDETRHPSHYTSNYLRSQMDQELKRMNDALASGQAAKLLSACLEAKNSSSNTLPL